MLGSIFAADPELRAKISIHTKCNNGQLPHKSLSKVRVLVRRTRRTLPAVLMASVGGAQESVLYQAETSLSNLQTESIDLFYLHGPDIKVRICPTLPGPTYTVLAPTPPPPPTPDADRGDTGGDR